MNRSALVVNATQQTSTLPVSERLSANIWQFLIDTDPLNWIRQVDWSTLCDRFSHPNFAYPDYYLNQDFHSIRGGYMTAPAALSYDLISRFLLFPNEHQVRAALIRAIQGNPRRILDLGCGTGAMTRRLKQAFPQAEVIGLDLSPYMLAIAHQKAEQENLSIHLMQGNAESTPFAANSFDVAIACLLLHETPLQASQHILREGYRLLRPGGQMIILDANQSWLKKYRWIDRVFKEPYLEEYMAEDVQIGLHNAGFTNAKTRSLHYVQQLSVGIKSAFSKSNVVTSTVLTEHKVRN